MLRKFGNCPDVFFYPNPQEWWSWSRLCFWVFGEIDWFTKTRKNVLANQPTYCFSPFLSVSDHFFLFYYISVRFCLFQSVFVRLGILLVSVLLSAHVKRFRVCRVQDFCTQVTQILWSVQYIFTVFGAFKVNIWDFLHSDWVKLCFIEWFVKGTWMAVGITKVAY